MDILILPCTAMPLTIAPVHDAADLQAWVRDQDHAAFSRLVERHAGLVRNACRRQLGDGDNADVAAQAVFILLARRAGHVREPSRLAGWLLGAARDICRHSRRSDARRRRHEQAAAVTAEELRKAAAPGGDSDWSQVRPLLDDALAGLSGAQRDVVVGYYLESRPQAEIGRRLGISEDAVKQRLHYGLGKLRSWFAHRGLTVAALALAAGLVSEAGAAEPAFTASCIEQVRLSQGRAADLADGIARAGTRWWLMAAVAAIAVVIIGAAAWVTWRGAPPSAAVAGSDMPPPPLLAPWLALPWRTPLDHHRPDEIAALLWTANPDRDLRLALPPALRSGPWQGIRWQPPQQARISDLLDAVAHATGTRWCLLGPEVVLFTSPAGTTEPLSAGVPEAVGSLLSGPPEQAVRALEGLALLPDAEAIDPPWLEPWLPTLLADQPGLASATVKAAAQLTGDARSRLLTCLPPGSPEALPLCQAGSAGWARAAAARHRSIPLPPAQQADPPLLLALGDGAASTDWLEACRRTDASGLALRLLYRRDPAAGIAAAQDLLSAAPAWSSRGGAREAAYALMRSAWRLKSRACSCARRREAGRRPCRVSLSGGPRPVCG